MKSIPGRADESFITINQTVKVEAASLERHTSLLSRSLASRLGGTVAKKNEKW